MKLILILTLTMMATLLANTPSQTSRSRADGNSSNEANSGRGKIAARQSNSPAPQLIAPPADHHAHIWSLSASRLVTEPLLPVVELPEDSNGCFKTKSGSAEYGREHSEAFLNQVLPAAPEIPIRIAHMAASGPNYHSDDAFEVYANAAANNDPRMKNVLVDVASMVTRNTRPETLELVAKRLRQLGLRRVLFASDRAPGGSNDTPKDAWEAFRRLPLTEQEFRTVAENVAPYMH